MAKGGDRKVGRNKARCAAYRLSNRREINKVRKLYQHLHKGAAMFLVEYVTPAKRPGSGQAPQLRSQQRASFTGAHQLARILKNKGCVSINVVDKATGNEVYYLWR